MNEPWQDRIDSELRTLRHQERHDHLAVERQLLRRGHVSVATDAEPVLTGERLRRLPAIVRRVLLAVRDARRAVVG